MNTHSWTMYNVSEDTIITITCNGDHAFNFLPRHKIEGLSDRVRWKLAELERRGLVVFELVGHKVRANWQVEGF